MLTPKESALLLDINQRLRKLHMQRAAAQGAHAEELRVQIDELTEDCDRVLEAADAT